MFPPTNLYLPRVTNLIIMSSLPQPSALLESTSNNFTSGGISNSTTVRLLPNDFTLGNKDVICGRGTTCFNHIGNEKFRDLIKSKLDRYLKAIAKIDKTLLIYEVVSEVRTKSPNGGFVKLDKSTGQYYEVGDFLAVSKHSTISQWLFCVIGHGVVTNCVLFFLRIFNI